MEGENKSFCSWLGERFSNLLDPQFILGIIILMAWLFFLMKPMSLLDNISLNDISGAKEKTALLLNLAAGISGLFTTALGFVLGHFFGKQGIASAEARTSKALQEKEVAEKEKHNKEKLVDNLEITQEQLMSAINSAYTEINLVKEQYKEIINKTTQFRKKL